MERNRRLLARAPATRVVGLTALCGLVALALGSVEAGGVEAAGASTHQNPDVTTSASFAVDLRLTVPRHYALDLRGSGKIDFAHRDAAISVELPSAGLHSSAAGQGVLPSSGPLRLQVEWIDGVVYLAVPSSLTALAGGAKALSHTVATDTAGTINTAIAQTAVALTYAHILVGTMAGRRAQHSAGTRTIGGVPASGAEVDLTLSQLLKVIPGLSPAVAHDTRAMANVKIPVTVWVDHQGRLVEVSLAAGPSSSQGSLTGTVRFSSYNVPVTIAAPAAGTVKPMSKSEMAILKAEDPFGGDG